MEFVQWVESSITSKKKEQKGLSDMPDMCCFQKWTITWAT